MASLFVLFGLLTFASALVLYIGGIISTSWPTTTGTVVETSIEERRPSATHRSRNGSGSQWPRYVPWVRYTYTVEGEPYQGDRIALDLATYRTAEEAATVTARYPVGTQVSVSYDLARPERAVLVPGRGGSYLLGGLVAVVGSIGGGLLLLRFGHIRLLQVRSTPSTRRTRLGHQTVHEADTT